MSKKAKVYVQGRAYASQTRQIFRDLSCTKDYELVTSIPDSDIVVWTGGEDISPEIYGEEAIERTQIPTKSRDLDDLRAVDEAFKGKKFLVGICRGAQLLNCVPNGGRLWQHVNNHMGHHRIFDCVYGTYLSVNSFHHQMMRPTKDADIVAWAVQSSRRESQHEIWTSSTDKADIMEPITEGQKDPEALWYPKTNSLCVQFHPEFGHPPTTQYFFRLMDAYFFGRINALVTPSKIEEEAA